MSKLTLVLIALALVNASQAKAEYWPSNDNEGMFDNYFRGVEKNRREAKEQQDRWQEEARDRKRQDQLDRIERNQNGGVGFKGGFGSFGNW